jgi:hypothetical protein
MQLGDVYFWQTGKAQGHVLRNKFHIYLCPSDWREENTFVFISKADYGGDFKITKLDCPFLDLDVSYISCSSLLFYSDEELASFPKKPVGRLSSDQLKKLYNALLASDTMEGWQISRACNALKAVL